MTFRAMLAVVVLCASPALAGADEIGICERGLMHHRDGDLPRAFLLLEGCTSEDAVAAYDQAKTQLSNGEFAAVSVIINPEGATVTIDALGDEPFIAPRDVFVPVGTHIVRASSEGYEDFAAEFIVRSTSDYPLVLRLDRIDEAKKAKDNTSTVDFGDEPGAAVGEHVISVDPDVEHETLLPKRYRGGGVGATIDGGASRLSVGVKAGMTVASLSGGGSAADSRIGAAAGGFATYSLGSAFALQPELYFAQKGVDGGGLNYIVVPALAMVAVEVHTKVRLYALAGPELAISLTSEVNGQDITTFDLGLAGGAGVLLPVVGRGLRIEGRYELGLNSVDGDDARNRAFTVSAGYAF
jgi:hypothetical protein